MCLGLSANLDGPFVSHIIGPPSAFQDPGQIHWFYQHQPPISNLLRHEQTKLITASGSKFPCPRDCKGPSDRDWPWSNDWQLQSHREDFALHVDYAWKPSHTATQQPETISTICPRRPERSRLTVLPLPCNLVECDMLNFGPFVENAMHENIFQVS